MESVRPLPRKKNNDLHICSPQTLFGRRAAAIRGSCFFSSLMAGHFPLVCDCQGSGPVESIMKRGRLGRTVQKRALNQCSCENILLLFGTLHHGGI